MPTYRAPGAYAVEAPGGARPIGAVGTSTAAFLGVAPDPTAAVGEVHAITTWTDFERRYVGGATQGTHLATAVDGFFRNGGGRCYVVNLGADGTLQGVGRSRGGLSLLDPIDEIAMVAAPGMTDLASYEALQQHCEDPLHQDRVAILDAPDPLGPDDVERLTRVATLGSALATSGRRAAAQPGGGPASGSDTAGGTAGGGDTDGGTGGDPGSDGLRPPTSEGGYTTLYAPWIRTTDPVTGAVVTCPPSGHVAGLWARTDATRGVQKAPANAPLSGALGLTYSFSRGDQELLNPAGVNCIRYFSTEGILVWGARTLADEASEWRYVNVRRLVNMLKESIVDGTRWTVFEPNDMTLWRSVRRDVGAFLTQVWRDGALFGASPAEAFSVKCDAENNPPESRDAGQLVVDIAIAPVKPAEFVVFRISQSAGAAGVQQLGA